MAIATVNPGNTITAQKYNEIQAQIDAVLGRNPAGYGASPSSIPVTRLDVIKSEHYSKLYNDIRRCLVHQSGTSMVFPDSAVAPAVGDVIYAAFTNSLIAAADQALANRYTVAASQLSNQISNQSTFPFDRSYVHTITYTWANNNDLRYYFNLGGRIEAAIGYSGSPGTPLETAWAAAVGVANAAMQTYTRADFEAGGVNSSKTLYTNNGTVDIILVRVTQISDVALRVTVEMSPSAPLANIGISSQAAFYYSRGDTVPAGVAAPLADIDQSLTLGTQITVPPPVVIARKTLSISPASATFSFEAGQTSSAQTFTLTNSGNTALTVSSINFTQNGGVSAQAFYSWSGALTLGAGDNASFSLSYSGPNPGSATNSFTVISDNDAGNITVPTTQDISAPAPVPFTFDLSPGSLSFSVTDAYSYPTFDFYIVNATGPYNYMYVSVESGQNLFIPTRFVVQQSGYYNANLYDTNNFTLRYTNNDANGTHLDSVSVTINGVTRTANLAVNRNVYIPANRNLGTWLSPLASYNAVIGASYDIINDQRYLTLGVGMGADGSPDLDRGGIGYIDAGAIANLGLSGDDNYQGGAVLYPSRSLGLPGILASTSEGGYGTWVISRETNDYWTNVLGNRRVPNSYFGNFDNKYLNYGFNCPSGGNYIIELGLSADNGYCQIDGNLAIDLRGGGNSYAINSTVQYLGAGFHSIDIIFTGGVFCAIAARITRQSDNLEIWSTRRPLRTSAPFRWWSEVYRMPIYANGTAVVHQSANWHMKSTRMIEADQTGYRWGDYCGDGARAGSMFTVIDDGYGNLTIELNSPRFALDQDKGSTRTLLMLAGSSLQNCFIYWTAYNRYRNLENQGSTGDYVKSNYFLGFNSDGSVRTTLVDNWDIQNVVTPVEIIYDYSGTGPAGNSGACCCFVADTKVSTPLGEKSIQTITTGSWVLSGNGQPTRVIGIIMPTLDHRPLYHIDGQQVTGDHLFKTPRGWACADLVRYRETRWNCITELECGQINLGTVPADQLEQLSLGSKILTATGVQDIKTLYKVQDPDPAQLVYSLVTESGDYQLASGHIVDGIPQT